jgi:hypothetical protein
MKKGRKEGSEKEGSEEGREGMPREKERGCHGIKEGRKEGMSRKGDQEREEGRTE